jgi:hypothetical protein
MKATISSDRTTRVVNLRIEPQGDECDFDATESWHARHRTVRPRHLTITQEPGGLRVKATGSILCQDGTPGGVSGEKSWDTRSWALSRWDDAPKWVKDLADRIRYGDPITDQEEGAS